MNANLSALARGCMTLALAAILAAPLMADNGSGYNFGPAQPPVYLPFLAKPTNLQVSSNCDGFTSFSWKDNSSSESGFRIYGKTAAGGYKLIKTVPANTTSTSASIFSKGSWYEFYVVAYRVSPSMTSAPSNKVSVQVGCPW